MKDEILYALLKECPWPNPTLFHFGEDMLWKCYGESIFSDMSHP
jgi:hypothetical protein